MVERRAEQEEQYQRWQLEERAFLLSRRKYREKNHFKEARSLPHIQLKEGQEQKKTLHREKTKKELIGPPAGKGGNLQTYPSSNRSQQKPQKDFGRQGLPKRNQNSDCDGTTDVSGKTSAWERSRRSEGLGLSTRERARAGVQSRQEKKGEFSGFDLKQSNKGRKAYAHGKGETKQDGAKSRLEPLENDTGRNDFIDEGPASRGGRSA